MIICIQILHLYRQINKYFMTGCKVEWSKTGEKTAPRPRMRRLEYFIYKTMKHHRYIALKIKWYNIGKLQIYSALYKTSKWLLVTLFLLTIDNHCPNISDSIQMTMSHMTNMAVNMLSVQNIDFRNKNNRNGITKFKAFLPTAGGN